MKTNTALNVQSILKLTALLPLHWNALHYFLALSVRYSGVHIVPAAGTWFAASGLQHAWCDACSTLMRDFCYMRYSHCDVRLYRSSISSLIQFYETKIRLQFTGYYVLSQIWYLVWDTDLMRRYQISRSTRLIQNWWLKRLLYSDNLISFIFWIPRNVFSNLIKLT